MCSVHVRRCSCALTWLRAEHSGLESSRKSLAHSDKLARGKSYSRSELGICCLLLGRADHGTLLPLCNSACGLLNSNICDQSTGEEEDRLTNNSSHLLQGDQGKAFLPSISVNESVDSLLLCLPLWWSVAGNPDASTPSSTKVRVLVLVVEALR